MKAYTDISQSKKLAEILSLESADMHYVLIEADEDKYDAGLGKYIGILPHYPCWSLAALLSVTPYNISLNKAVYRFKLVKHSNYWECYHEILGAVSTEVFKADNPVDACYEMILKLHKLNLL